MNWEKPVLVTGAGGFIGSHLVEALAAQGARVRALVRYNSRNHWGHLEKLPVALRPAVEVRLADVTDPFAVRALVEGCEAVFHLAALIGIPYSYLAPASYAEINLKGTLNVLEACRAAGVGRLIHTSTSEVYGTALYTPIDEAHPLQGQSPYSASKIAADQLADSYHRSFGVPVSTVRPFNTYGPRQSARAVIPTIVAQLLAGDVVRLGQLDVVRDFTHVSDTVAGFLAVARCEACVGRVINLGSGHGVTVRELVEIIGRLLGRTPRLVVEEQRLRPERSEVFRLIADAGLARRLTGWTPQVPLEAGLRTVIEYVRAHGDEYKPELYTV